MSWGDYDNRISRLENDMWRKANSCDIEDVKSENRRLSSELNNARLEIGNLQELLQRLQLRVDGIEERDLERERLEREKEDLKKEAA